MYANDPNEVWKWLKVEVLLFLHNSGSPGQHGSTPGRRIATVVHCLPLPSVLSLFGGAMLHAPVPRRLLSGGNSHNQAIDYAEEHLQVMLIADSLVSILYAGNADLGTLVSRIHLFADTVNVFSNDVAE